MVLLNTPFDLLTHTFTIELSALNFVSVSDDLELHAQGLNIKVLLYGDHVTFVHLFLVGTKVRLETFHDFK